MGWLNRFLKMIHVYTAYKRNTLDVRTQTESQRMKKVSHVMVNQKKAGVAKLTYEKQTSKQ